MRVNVFTHRLSSSPFIRTTTFHLKKFEFMVSNVLCAFSLAGLCGPGLANACVATVSRTNSEIIWLYCWLVVGCCGRGGQWLLFWWCRARDIVRRSGARAKGVGWGWGLGHSKLRQGTPPQQRQNMNMFTCACGRLTESNSEGEAHVRIRNIKTHAWNETFNFEFQFRPRPSLVSLVQWTSADALLGVKKLFVSHKTRYSS